MTACKPILHLLPHVCISPLPPSMDIIHEHAPLVYLDRDEIVIDGKPNRFVSRCPIAFAATKHPLDLILAEPTSISLLKGPLERTAL